MDINKNKNNEERLRKSLLKLPDFCFDYFLSISTNTSILTRINYSNDLVNFFEFLINNIEFSKFVDDTSKITINHIKKIKTLDIEKYLNYVTAYSKKNNANNEIELSNDNAGKKRKLSSIRTLFSYLYKRGFIDSDVSAIIDTPKIKEKPILRLNEQETNKLIDTVRTGEGLTQNQLKYHKKTALRDTAIIVLLLNTGIRLSEIIGIDLNDVYFEENAFKVTRKGGGVSILYYSNQVKEIIKAYYDERIEIPREKCDTTALFLSLQNKRISKRSLENMVKKYSQIVNPLKNISPHKLRSTFGTMLYNQSGDIYLVADVLGHKDVNTTKKHYAAMSDEHRREVPDFVNITDEEQ